MEKPKRKKIIHDHYDIYCVTNKLNNKSYVGISCDIQQRWRNHIKDSRKTIKNNSKNRIHAFQRALKKYGYENFNWQIIESHNNLNDANQAEEFFIAYLQTKRPFGYNILSGGDNKKMSEETKKKISETLKITGNFVGKKGALHPNYGTKLSEERKNNLKKYLFDENNVHITAKLNKEKVKEIYLEYLNNPKIYPPELGKKYGVAMNTIRNILNKKSWKEVTKDLPNVNLEDRTKGEQFLKSKITNEQAKQIKLEILEMKNRNERGILRKLSEKFNVSEGIISGIYFNKYWKHIKI